MNALKNEQKPRITIYCNDEDQKEYIISRLSNLKDKYDVKNNADAIEFLIINYLRIVK